MKNKNDIHKTTIVALVLLMIAISIISGVLSYKAGYKKQVMILHGDIHIMYMYHHQGRSAICPTATISATVRI